MANMYSKTSWRWFHYILLRVKTTSMRIWHKDFRSAHHYRRSDGQNLSMNLYKVWTFDSCIEEIEIEFESKTSRTTTPAKRFGRSLRPAVLSDTLWVERSAFTVFTSGATGFKPMGNTFNTWGAEPHQVGLWDALFSMRSSIALAILQHQII